MEINLKNHEVLNAMQSIKQLLQVEDTKFPVKTRWNLMKNMKKFESVYKTFSEMEFNLLKQYALKDGDNEIVLDEQNNPKFSPKSKTEYLLKHTELLNCENQVDLLSVDLSDLEGFVPQGEILYHLEFMINEDN